MERVFIVTAVEGDYENKDVWGCGVYLTLEDAQKVVDEAVGRANTRRAWERRRDVFERSFWEVEALEGKACPAGNEAFIRWARKARHEAKALIGEEPPEERGDMFFITEVPIGQWGKFVIDEEQT
jgi:hypothetical protein